MTNIIAGLLDPKLGCFVARNLAVGGRQGGRGRASGCRSAASMGRAPRRLSLRIVKAPESPRQKRKSPALKGKGAASLLDYARTVLDAEAAAISSLKKRLGEPFVKALE